MNRTSIATACLMLLAVTSTVAPLTTRALSNQESSSTDAQDKAVLGKLLFNELLFTNPASDYHSSCSGCHVEDKGWADSTPTSLLPNKQTTTRNSQTLNDFTQSKRFGWDGRFDSLEQMIEWKMTGELSGWSPADADRARDAIHFTLLNEGDGGGTGPSYVDRFKAAYDVDLESLPRDQAVQAAARVLADFSRSIESTETSRWDAFAEQNRFRTGPNEGQSAVDYAYFLESRIGNQEGRRLIRRPEGFSADAYFGFKTFMRVYGEEGQSVGNCVSCHTPPHFSDFEFHNSGVSEAEYDNTHGAGKFAAFDPGTPSEATRSASDRNDPTKVDLGYWNFAPAGERAANLGAFKTPTLRNVEKTGPYMHNGTYESLRDVVLFKMKMAEKARSDAPQGIDPEYQKMVLKPEDVPQLVAFLQQLTDVGQDDFRYFLIHFEQDDLWPEDH